MSKLYYSLVLFLFSLMSICLSNKAILAQGLIQYATDDNPCTVLFDEGGAGGGQDPLVIATSSTKSRAVLQKLSDFPGWVSSAQVSPDRKLVVVTESRGISWWSMSSGKIITLWKGDFKSLAFSQDWLTMALENEHTIMLVDTNTGKQIATIPEFFNDFILSPNGQKLAVIAGKLFNEIQLWDVQTGKKIQQLAPTVQYKTYDGRVLVGMGHGNRIESMVFSPDGKTLLTASADHTLRLWDIATGRHLHCYEFRTEEPAPLLLIKFSPDGKIAALLDGYSNVYYFWDLVKGNLLRKDSLGYKFPIRSAAFQPNLESLLTIGYNTNIIYQWDLNTGKLRGYLRHPVAVKSTEFSLDGKTIIATLTDSQQRGSVWLWNAGHKDLAQAAAAENMVMAGIGLALQGNTDEAKINLKRAQSLNPYREYNVEQEGFVRTIDAFAAQISRLVVNNDLNSALVSVKYAIDLDSKSPIPWNALCWSGSLYGHAMDVLPACDQAVKLAPQNPDLIDSRGLARALVGDIQGAIEDFKFVIANQADSSMDSFQLEDREKWLQALQAGQNPFDENTLLELRGE